MIKQKCLLVNFIGLIILYSLVSCTREWNNPYDELGNNYDSTLTRIPPRAAFFADPLEVREGGEIKFIDQSVDNPTEWKWDLGDGNISKEQNPVHIYNSKGIYTITLTVANEFGSDSQTNREFITVLPGVDAKMVD